MSITSGLGLIRRWWLLCIVMAALGFEVGYVLLQQLPPIYQASVTLLVGQGSTAIGLGSDQLQGAQQLAQTYAEAVRSRPILTQAAADANRQLSYAQFDARLHAARVPNTQLLRISVDGANPAEAADLANSVAKVFVDSNQQQQASRFATSFQNLAQLVDSIQTQIDAQTQQVAQIQAQPASPERDAQLARAQDELTQLIASRAATMRSVEDLRVIQAQTTNLLTVLDPAAPPDEPARPSRPLVLGLGVLGGLLLGAALAIVLEFRRDRLGNQRRISAATGAVLLGTIPFSGGASKLRKPGGPLAESFRLLRSRLQSTSRDNNQRLGSIVVASAASKEGSSTVAAHLAVALAEWGHQVILVDANMHRAAQARLFEVPDEQGMSTLLVDGGSVESVLAPTWQPRLRVMPAGPRPSDPSALLSTRRLTEILRALSELCDVLVIDTPPTLGQPDATLLAAEADGVLLVIDARRSRGRQVSRAVDLLASSGASPLGVVVNRAPRGWATLDLSRGGDQWLVDDTATARNGHVRVGAKASADRGSEPPSVGESAPNA